MAPRDAFDGNRDFVDGEESEDEGNNDEVVAGIHIADANDRRAFLAAARREEREYASREMRRQNELRDELRNSVEAMEIMIQSQQRIDELTRSLNELRELHQRMMEAGIGQDSDDEESISGGSGGEDDMSLNDDAVAGADDDDDEEANDSGGVFELEEDDDDCSISKTTAKEGANPISSTIVSSPPSTRKHGHT